MQYRKLSNTGIDVSVVALGTWSFGNDKWWGHQDDTKSYDALSAAVDGGVNVIDTAPVYGRGKSEEVVGKFITDNHLREKIIIATKLGLDWDKNGPKIFHDLKPERMRQEFDDSRKRLRTDYFDLYQVHWPDKNVPIAQTAEIMHEWHEKKLIRAVGVSNYSIEQMQEFMRYCPLHSLQPQYSMFCRDIECDIVDFCEKNNIAILPYAPLFSGILTGKFYFNNVPVPNDINRTYKAVHFKEPLCSINKEFLGCLRDMAAKYGKSLGQLVLNWTMNQKGVTSILVGSRNSKQVLDNVGCCDWEISKIDIDTIAQLLGKRECEIKK
jgi:aryl-alcohol dehydrogenase-like predicted oxidoreductase